MIKFSEMKFVKPNLTKIQKDFTKAIEEFQAAETFEEQFKIFKKINKYSDHLSTNFTIGSIKYSLDSLSEENQKNQELMDEIGPLIAAINHKLNQVIVASKFRKEFEEKVGSHYFKMLEQSLQCFDEKIIPELQELNRLDSEHTKVIASAQIPFRGEVYNLSQLGKFAQSSDRQTRKEASILSAKFFEDHNEEIGAIYDKMVKIRHQIALKLGYKNFVDLGYKMLGRTDYRSPEVKSYRDQIYKDLVPYTNKLFKEQAVRLGIKNPQYYDFNLMFLSGNATPKGDPEYLVKQAQKMYNELSEETGTFFKFMNDYEMMDLVAKKGKVGGGFMTYLPDYKSPFIFSNFNGTSGDVDVLTHEFGHAFQGYMSRNISIPDYRSPTLEACEIHSMSMEFITYPWMKYFFEEDTDKYLYSHLVDAITFIPYGTAIDEFQHFVYENPEVNHAERCAKWREIEKKYLPYKKYKDTPVFENGGWWMKQSHLFGSPFYYIDYTLAQVCAFQFFNLANKDHDKCWKKYVKLCKLGGRYPFTELLSKVGLKNPFVEGTVKQVVRPLKKYLAQFDATKF